MDPPDPPDAEVPDAMPDAFSCPEGFTQAGLGCYRVETTDRTWHDAETACEALGGHLVIIDGLQENLTVSGLAGANALFDPWIGLTDHAAEDVFRWVSDSFPGYTNWGGGEPNNSGSWGAPEDCTELRSDGTWNDAECDLGGDSICEHDGLPIGVIFW